MKNNNLLLIKISMISQSMGHSKSLRWSLKTERSHMQEI